MGWDGWGFRLGLPVVTHNWRCYGKMGHCRGMNYCLGGLTGAPWSQIVDMGPLVRDGVGRVGWDGMVGVLG